MKIFNGNKVDDQSVVINKKVLEDACLDYRTRGLLVTLIGLPNGSEIEISELVNRVDRDRDDEMLKDTKAAVRTCLEYLEMLGYLQKVSGTKGLDYAINQTPAEVNCTYNSYVQTVRTEHERR